MTCTVRLYTVRLDDVSRRPVEGVGPRCSRFWRLEAAFGYQKTRVTGSSRRPTHIVLEARFGSTVGYQLNLFQWIAVIRSRSVRSMTASASTSHCTHDPPGSLSQRKRSFSPTAATVEVGQLRSVDLPIEQSAYCSRADAPEPADTKTADGGA